MRAHHLREFGLIGLVAVGLVACTSAHQRSQSEPASADVVCVTKRVTGSLMPRRVCGTRAKIENGWKPVPKAFIFDNPPPINHSR